MRLLKDGKRSITLPLLLLLLPEVMLLLLLRLLPRIFCWKALAKGGSVSFCDGFALPTEKSESLWRLQFVTFAAIINKRIEGHVCL